MSPFPRGLGMASIATACPETARNRLRITPGEAIGPVHRMRFFGLVNVVFAGRFRLHLGLGGWHGTRHPRLKPSPAARRLPLVPVGGSAGGWGDDPAGFVHLDDPPLVSIN